jgi:hypothetical protein
MSIIPRIVEATLLERFVFNFRLRPEELAERLPVKWLQPQVFNGWSVVSFCILKLGQVTVWPIPQFLGMQTTSCAYRCGVLDTSPKTKGPAVYVTDRNTDLAIIARLGPWLLADSFPMIKPTIIDTGDSHSIHITYLDGEELFAAQATKQPTGEFVSQVFPTLADFSAFIHNGVLSYAPSIYGDALTAIDLFKEDPVYEPLIAEVDFSKLDGLWADAKLEFDSAVRAHGGEYKWTYQGLASEIAS